MYFSDLFDNYCQVCIVGNEKHIVLSTGVACSILECEESFLEIILVNEWITFVPSDACNNEKSKSKGSAYNGAENVRADSIFLRNRQLSGYKYFFVAHFNV